ncbi:MAG: MMPL family transporter [Cytophagales bacterium]|nr:MMPL family transporter [Cytophagales bacterium]
MSRSSKTSAIANILLLPAVARKLAFGTLGISLVLAIFLPRLQFQFELESLFAESGDHSFYLYQVEAFGFDNDFLNLMVVPDESSVYRWKFLEDMRATIKALEQLEDVEFVYSPLSLRKLIKGPSGVQTYPLLNAASKLQSDSLFIANDPYLSQAFPASNVFVILIKHRHFLDAKASELFMEKVKPIADTLPYEQHYLVGRLPAEKEFLSYIKTDFAVFLALSLVLCGVVLWWICRSAKLVLYPFLISVLSLIWTFGLMALLGVPVTIMTSLLPPIVLFVACSDTIHLIAAFRTSGNAQSAIEKVLAPTFLTSVTTAIGFLSLLWIPVSLIRNMGWIAALSVLFAFITTYMLAPLFLKGKVTSVNSGNSLTWILQVTKRYGIAIIIGFFLLTGTGLWASLRLNVDAYLLHDMPSDALTVQSFNFSDEQLGGSKPYEVAIWPKDTSKTIWDAAVLVEASKIVKYLEQSYPVANVLAPTKFMQYARHARHGIYDLKQISRQDQLLARRIERQSSIQVVSEDERLARITGNIKEYGSLNTNERDAAFKEYVRKNIDHEVIQYRITGTNHLIDQTHHLLAGSMAKSLGWAVLLVSILFGIYFRSAKWSLIALIPNVVPLLITGLLMYVLKVPIQLSTSLIFVLVFGIVVDDTIHFLATFKRSPAGTTEEKLDYTMETSGRGMLHTTITLVAGFALFLLSGFGGTYYLGFFLCIALITALITDWLLLPVILRKFNRN